MPIIMRQSPNHTLHNLQSTCHSRAVQLLQDGELAPGLTTEEFAARRRRLAEALPPDSVAILPASPPKYIAGVVPYPYRAVSRLGLVCWIRVSKQRLRTAGIDSPEAGPVKDAPAGRSMRYMARFIAVHTAGPQSFRPAQ